MAVAKTSTTTWCRYPHVDASTWAGGVAAGFSFGFSAVGIAVLPEVLTGRNADLIAQLGQADLKNRDT
jgi:hypothetical protein